MALVKIHSRKDFINKSYNHSDGSIFSEVTVSKNSSYSDLNCTLKIRDCDRVIHLSINPGMSKGGLANSNYKIDTIIEHLKTLRKGINEGWKLSKALIAKSKANDKRKSRQTSRTRTVTESPTRR